MGRCAATPLAWRRHSRSAQPQHRPGGRRPTRQTPRPPGTPRSARPGARRRATRRRRPASPRDTAPWRKAWTRRPATLAVRAGERRLRAHRGAGPPRVGCGQAVALPSALVAQGAAAARRGGRRADRGPEVEHRLVELPGASGREQAIGQGLGLAQRQTRSRHAPRQDPGHVGVDRRHIGLEGEGQHRPRRVGADAGQRRAGRARRRERRRRARRRWPSAARCRLSARRL